MIFRSMFVLLLAVAIAAASSTSSGGDDHTAWTTELHASTYPVSELYGSQQSFQVSAMNTAKDTLFAADINGTAYAVDIETGRILWEASGVSPTCGDALGYEIILVYSGSSVVMSIGQNMTGFDPATGRTMWQRQAPLDAGVFTLRAFPQYDIFIIQSITAFNILALHGKTGEKVYSFGYNTTVFEVNQLEVSEHNFVAVTSDQDDFRNKKAEIRSIATGELRHTVPGAVNCGNFKSQSRYLACTVVHQEGEYDITLALKTVDLSTNKTVWKVNLTDATANNKPTIHVASSIVLVVVNPILVYQQKGYVLAFDLAGGGAPVWNTTLGFHFAGVTNSFYEHEGLLVTGILISPNPQVPTTPIQFVALDDATGRVFWAVQPPSMSKAQLVFLPGGGFLVPNTMGWTRYNLAVAPATDDASVKTPVLEYHTLSALSGLTNLLPIEGINNQYLVIAGDTISRYAF